VSKGVVTYHFAAKDDLISAVIADVLGSMAGYVQPLRGQAQGLLGPFSARVMAASLKAVLDDLLTQFAADPGLDIEAYGAELVALFERASRPGPHDDPASAPGQAPASTTLEER
jgi:AcrR family transcriptional regulator